MSEDSKMITIIEALETKTYDIMSDDSDLINQRRYN